MKKLMFLSLILVLGACTKNARARQFGGTEKILLKPDEVLINVTWKESNLWILTEDTITHKQYFRESSSWGVWNGEIELSH